jgi:hypothetical protein
VISSRNKYTMRDLINLIEAASSEVFERCQAGDKITFSDGECGYGVYAYPVKYSAKMRAFYGEGGARTVFRLTLKTGYVVDLTDPRIMPSLLIFAREQFARMKTQMTYYQEPKVNKSSIQRFGAIVEDFVRANYSDAAGYTISHELSGSNLPKAKQTVITKLDHFDVQITHPGRVDEAVGGFTLDSYKARRSPFGARDVIEEPGYLYHGTAKTRLPGIRREGLKPSTKSRFSRDPFIGDYSLGKVFFATNVDKAKFYALEASKPQPMLLRVPVSAAPNAAEDTKDTDSVFVEKPIPATVIEYWSGKAWKPVAQGE